MRSQVRWFFRGGALAVPALSRGEGCLRRGESSHDRTPARREACGRTRLPPLRRARLRVRDGLTTVRRRREGAASMPQMHARAHIELSRRV